jgi:hypothetical protein
MDDPAANCQLPETCILELKVVVNDDPEFHVISFAIKVPKFWIGGTIEKYPLIANAPLNVVVSCTVRVALLELFADKVSVAPELIVRFLQTAVVIPFITG